MYDDMSKQIQVIQTCKNETLESTKFSIEELNDKYALSKNDKEFAHTFANEATAQYMINSTMMGREEIDFILERLDVFNSYAEVYKYYYFKACKYLYKHTFHKKVDISKIFDKKRKTMDNDLYLKILVDFFINEKIQYHIAKEVGLDSTQVKRIIIDSVRNAERLGINLLDVLREAIRDYDKIFQTGFVLMLKYGMDIEVINKLFNFNENEADRFLTYITGIMSAPYDITKFEVYDYL